MKITGKAADDFPVHPGRQCQLPKKIPFALEETGVLCLSPCFCPLRGGRVEGLTSGSTSDLLEAGKSTPAAITVDDTAAV